MNNTKALILKSLLLFFGISVFSVSFAACSDISQEKSKNFPAPQSIQSFASEKSDK